MNKYKNVSILFKLVQKLSAILVRPLANDLMTTHHEILSAENLTLQISQSF